MDRHRTHPVRTLAVAGMVALPVLVGFSGPAFADRERSFRCNDAEIDFSVEREDGAYKVEVKIDETPARARWKIVVKQNGTRFHRAAQRADADGEIEREFRRPDTTGRDLFELKVSQLGDDICQSRISVR